MACRNRSLVMMGVAWTWILLVSMLREAAATSFCEQVIQPLGYACTEYTVQTADGFVLVMHRLGHLDWPTLTGENDDTRFRPEEKNTSSVGPQTEPQPSSRSSKSTSAPGFSKQGAQVTYGSSKLWPPLIPSIGHPFRHPANISATMPPANTSSPQPAPLSSNWSASDTPRPSDAPVEPTASPNRSSPGLQPSQTNSTASTHPTASGPTSSAQPNSDSVIPASAPSADFNMTSRNFTAHPGVLLNVQAGKGAPVLLMHQEFLNGDSWFQYVDAQHSGHLLPSMLFRDGFDVWVGHQRATYWGHDHVQLHFTDREFWNWTWDQHAQYDLPAQLRFINAETNQTVHYIGASQAATVGAAGATDPVTVSMIRSLTLIGPTVYRGNTNSLLLDAWAYFFGFSLDSEFYATGFQNGAFNYSSEFNTGPIYGSGPTGLAIGLISGPNCCLGSAVISFDNGWDGTTSFKNLLHWQQGIRKNTWQHYDYNNGESNYVAYGQPTSPFYNPALIPATLPVLVIAGDKDWTAPRQGINVFLTQLQNSATVVNLSNYAHYDLTYSATRDIDVYMPILQFLEGPAFAPTGIIRIQDYFVTCSGSVSTMDGVPGAAP